MRYCIGCGAPIGNERFCDKCGTDNGVIASPDKEAVFNRRQNRINRFCIGCGNEIGEERFCPVCGTDNGQIYNTLKKNHSYKKSSSSERKVKAFDIHINPDMILHWAAIVFLFIAAILLLKTTYSDTENTVSVMLLNPFGVAFAAGYFVLGAWSIIPAAAFILGGSRWSVKKVSITAVFLLILTAASYVLNFIVIKFSDLPAVIGMVSAMFSVYRVNMPYLIFFEIVTIAAAAAATYFAGRKEISK